MAGLGFLVSRLRVSFLATSESEMATKWPQLISPLNTILRAQGAYPYLKSWWRIRDSNP
jgi:hypothetical protein